MLRKRYIFTTFACVAGQPSSPRWIEGTCECKMTLMLFCLPTPLHTVRAYLTAGAPPSASSLTRRAPPCSSLCASAAGPPWAELELAWPQAPWAASMPLGRPAAYQSSYHGRLLELPAQPSFHPPSHTPSAAPFILPSPIPTLATLLLDDTSEDHERGEHQRRGEVGSEQEREWTWCTVTSRCFRRPWSLASAGDRGGVAVCSLGSELHAALDLRRRYPRKEAEVSAAALDLAGRRSAGSTRWIQPRRRFAFLLCYRLVSVGG
jgi:hypothetical protein